MRKIVTIAVLVIAMLMPSLPVCADCGCGGHPFTADAANDQSNCCSDATCKAQSESPLSCCQRPANSTSCCGMQGPQCNCSDNSSCCQCGDNCRCGETEEPSQEVPATPAPDSESVIFQLAAAHLAMVNTEVVSAQPVLIRREVAATDGITTTSTERCSQLGRFLI